MVDSATQQAMYPTLSAVFHWLQTNEPIAIWLEGIALVAIFGLELAEYKRQGRERIEQHEESAVQMAIMQSQADAANANAEAARLNAQAVLNSERAWIEISLEPPQHFENVVHDFFVCSIQIKNHGRTLARIESIQIGMDTVDGPIPERPSNSTTVNLQSLLGSGQTEKVGAFDADDFADGVNIVTGTHRGILRIIVKYRDVVNASIPHETSAFYVFQNSLEDEPEKVSYESVYT